MLKLRRRHWPWCLGCSISTTTYMVISLHFKLIINLDKHIRSQERNSISGSSQTSMLGDSILRISLWNRIWFNSSALHTDALFWLPLDVMDSKNGNKATLFNIYQIETLPVTATDIQRTTHRDPVLTQVLHFTQSGWPEYSWSYFISSSRRFH